MLLLAVTDEPLRDKEKEAKGMEALEAALRDVVLDLIKAMTLGGMAPVQALCDNVAKWLPSEVEQATKRIAEYLKAKQGDPATPPARHAHLLRPLDVLNTVTEAEGTGMGLPNTDDEPESTGDTAAAAAATASGETAGAVVLTG